MRLSAKRSLTHEVGNEGTSPDQASAAVGGDLQPCVCFDCCPTQEASQVSCFRPLTQLHFQVVALKTSCFISPLWARTADSAAAKLLNSLVRRKYVGIRCSSFFPGTTSLEGTLSDMILSPPRPFFLCLSVSQIKIPKQSPMPNEPNSSRREENRKAKTDTQADGERHISLRDAFTSGLAVSNI